MTSTRNWLHKNNVQSPQRETEIEAMTELITDDELRQRIQREGRFIGKLSRADTTMKDFEEWSLKACKALSEPHTLADAKHILTQWQKAREPLRNPRWIPTILTKGRVFDQRLSEVEIVEPLSWGGKRFYPSWWLRAYRRVLATTRGASDAPQRTARRRHRTQRQRSRRCGLVRPIAAPASHRPHRFLARPRHTGPRTDPRRRA